MDSPSTGLVSPAPFVRSVDDRIHAVQDKIENDLLQLDPVALYTGAEAKRPASSLTLRISA